MAKSSPQSFEKRQRERNKQNKRAEKLERRLIRNEEKRYAKMEENGELDEDGNPKHVTARKVAQKKKEELYY